MNAVHPADTAWQGPATPEDLAQLYRAFLGREAEAAVLQGAEQRPLHEVVAEMAASEELDQCVLHALVQQRPLPHLGLAAEPLRSLGQWLGARLGCPALPATEATAGTEAPTAAELLTRLYAHPAIAELLLLAHGSLFTQALTDLALLLKAGRYRLKGKIEFVNREHISGWVVDEAGKLAHPQLEIRLKEDGRLVAAASAHSYRPDIHKLFGGSGLAGFRAKWDPRQFAFGQAIEFTLHEASTGAEVGRPYRFENSFVDQLTVAQMLAHEFESIQQRLDALAGMVPQALSYCAFPLEHYRYYRRAHRVPPPPWLIAWQEESRLLRHRSLTSGDTFEEPPLPRGPHFTVLLDATFEAASATAVRISIDSLRSQQSGLDWQVHIVGSSPAIGELATLLSASTGRIRHATDWAAAAQIVLQSAIDPESWCILLQAGELLDPNALAWLHAMAVSKPATALYWDEDQLQHRGGHRPGRQPEHVAPILRAHFDAFSMLEMNVVGTSLAARSDRLDAAVKTVTRHPAPATITTVVAPHPLDAAERERLIWALQGEGAIAHIPQRLLTRTAEAGATGDASDSWRLLAKASPESLRALLPSTWRESTWSRMPDPVAPSRRERLVRWRPSRPTSQLSVLIPTRDHWQLVQECIDSLYEHAAHPSALDIIVADNGSTDATTLRYLAEQQSQRRLRILRVDEPFNWSRLNNQMASEARGEFLLFLNNDTRMLTHEWDDILRGLLEREEVGAVGARLLYEDMTIQHAGVMFGYESFVGHVSVGRAVSAEDGAQTSQLTRCVSAVTGAFLACSARIFFEVAGPFNQLDLGVTFNDVEWCVRLTESGRRICYAPTISLIHYESKSRGFDFTSLDKQRRAEYERERLLCAYPESFLTDPLRHRELSGWFTSTDALR